MSDISHWMRVFGFDLKRFVKSLAELGRYRDSRRQFRTALSGNFAWGRELPILDEWSQSSGSLGAYFQQDLEVARWIHEVNPMRHIDVGSRIDGFIGHLAVFRQVEVIDIRPQPQPIKNVLFHQLDLMDVLPDEWLESTESLSCLHTIEHFGMGRYGDPIDADGHLKGLEQLKRMVAPGGMFYLSTPIGPQRVEFNAHRIFAAATLLEWFGKDWTIERFCYVDDNGVLHENVDYRSHEAKNHFGCQTGLGIVAARKGRMN
ncbi:MAG: DUF268 domain-containing protein [Luteolibacter sp.]